MDTKLKIGTLLVLLLAYFTATTNAFDTEELEIFDLVEDINENFYSLLGVHQVSVHHK